MVRRPDDPDDHGLDEQFDVGFLVGLILALLACVAFVMWLLTRPVKAHMAQSGWTYPWVCCAGNDCAEISATNIRDSPAGYIVTVTPGAHPMWRADRREALRIVVPYAKAQASPDGRWHLCINGAGALLCFYHVPGGV
jgi:hypothetical protein